MKKKYYRNTIKYSKENLVPKLNLVYSKNINK